MANYRINSKERTIKGNISKFTVEEKADVQELVNLGYTFIQTKSKPKKKNSGEEFAKILSEIKDADKKELFTKIKETSPKQGGGFLVARTWYNQGMQVKDGKPYYMKKAKKDKAGKYQGGIETVINI